MASNELYPFATAQQQTRFAYLTQQYRCLVCQNETLADSSAPLALDLKQKIADLVKAGKSDEEITEFLVQRYGDFILFQPPLKSTTYLLWFAPVIFVLIGMLILWGFVRQKNKT